MSAMASEHILASRIEYILRNPRMRRNERKAAQVSAFEWIHCAMAAEHILAYRIECVSLSTDVEVVHSLK